MNRKKIMHSLRHSVLVLLLIAAAVLLSTQTVYIGVERSRMVQDFARLTRQLHIQNLVTTVYLGPRLMDTFLEVMVVIMTVIGVKSLRSHL
jgi:multisubunit Na+/H+ antiporter MnhB subunit